ncbi:AraC family transcriptional regulator [Pseudomonas sp. CFBP 8770]|nr:MULTISPECIES: AraC family transcriptional regulator [unclassified Pseudomonas]MBD8473189.1 AraC family transcriptional regulator [Pseudomonas sp. CFBP 8773]MBD8595925.1 AraC family transcriptional regulator [Pseudomonas sp. CFBP 8758]MBD8646316.1 AraC family transcriptional regulator [Pseudomonas sp. CFBP 8770]MBD8733536.1 AraC family transcriptional regulator [Pseudomonas sp. CFBP 13710]
MVSRVMKPHRIIQMDRSEKLDAKMHHLALGEISISRLRYGAKVEIDCDPLDGCFLIQMPMGGTANITVGNHGLVDGGEVATVLSPSDAAHMQWSHDMDQLIMKVSRNLLERTLVGHLGHSLHEPLRFEHAFAWRSSPAWRHLLSYLMECAVQAPDLAQHKFVLPQIEQLTTSILLATHQHNYSKAAPERRHSILPRHVRRVQDFITAHAHEQISPEQLAMIAGVSLRSLYSGFKEFLGISPMQYLRNLRMESVREELVSGEANNVAGVALRWGFAHLGRFSTEYKQRYGETPRQTLRRA